jgi:hypothetical protein
MGKYNRGRISEDLISQENNQAQNGIVIPNDCLSLSVTCTSDSGNNAFIGFNEPATNKNLLQPGESIPYGDIRVTLQGNKLYVGFDPTGTGGKVRISYLIDQGEC